jgi:hypothetical protein
MHAVRDGVRKTCVVAFLLLCIGIQCAEASGYWDTSIQDTGDELSVVAIALCIGVAVSVAATLVARVRAARATSESLSIRATSSGAAKVLPSTVSPFISPPLALRI